MIPNNQISTYHQRPQHREIPQNQHNHDQQQSQIGQQAKQVTNESKVSLKVHLLHLIKSFKLIMFSVLNYYYHY